MKHDTPSDDERLAEAIDLFAAGGTSSDLARRWGISRQAVSQWLMRRGFDPRRERNAWTARRADRQEAERVAALRAVDDQTMIRLLSEPRNASAVLGFSPTPALQAKAWGGVRFSAAGTAAQQVTLAQVVRLLRAAAAAGGVPVETLTPATYGRIAEAEGLPGPQTVTFMARRVGVSFAAACRTAGGQHASNGLRLGGPQPMAPAAVIDTLRQFMADSPTWTWGAYRRWAAEHPPAAATRHTIIAVLAVDSWGEAMAAAFSGRELPPTGATLAVPEGKETP